MYPSYYFNANLFCLSDSPTCGRYSASRATVSSQASWSRIRPIAFVVLWSSRTMRVPPVLPQLAPAVHLLIGQAAETLEVGRRMTLNDLLPIFKTAEREVHGDAGNTARLAALTSDHILLPNTGGHVRSRLRPGTYIHATWTHREISLCINLTSW